jgi:hypothetical protein
MRNIVKYTDYKQYHATARIIYNGEDITDKKDTTQPDSNQPPPPKNPKP